MSEERVIDLGCVIIPFIIVFFIALMIGDLRAESKKNYGNMVVDTVISVYDGDTLRVNFEKLHPIVGDNISVRINGIDTPEIRTKYKKEKILARQARDFVVNMLNEAKVVEVRNVKRGKYFRIIGDLYADNESVAQALINERLAIPYFGKRKDTWPEMEQKIGN